MTENKHFPAKKIALVENLGSEFYNSRVRYAQFLQAQGHHVVAVIPNDGLIEQIKALGIPVIPINLNVRANNVANSVRYWRLLYSIFSREKFDIVHTYKMPPNIIGTSAAFFANRKSRLFNHITGVGLAFTSKSLKYQIISNVIRLVFFINSNAFGTGLIYQNYGNRKQVGVFKNSTIIKGSSVNESIFLTPPSENTQELRNELGLPNYPTLLFVSRLLRLKGLHFLTEALIKYNKQTTKKFNLLVVGWIDEDSPDSYTQGEIDELSKNEHIFFIGKRSDIANLLDVAEIGVLPTLFPEGTPRSILEAMAKGKAVLTTKIAGCDHLVLAGENGYLVEPSSVDSIIDALGKLAARDLIEMGAASRQHYLAEFSEKIVFNSIEHFYFGKTYQSKI